MKRHKMFSHMAELGVALAVVWILVQLFSAYRDFQRDAVPATAFFQVVDFHIPDHVVGGNPVVSYDREILKPFRGFWVAEVQKRSGDGFEPVCFRPGAANYDPEDQLPDPVTLEWLLVRLCDLPPDEEYRIQLGWDIMAEGYPLKQVSFFSNWFRVLPE